MGGNYWDSFDSPSEGCEDDDTDGFYDSPYVFQDSQSEMPWVMRYGWANGPPDCSTAETAHSQIWPPNSRFVQAMVVDVTDPDGDSVRVTIDSILQNEPAAGGSGPDTSPDGLIVGGLAAGVIAERAPQVNGRSYHLCFTATDGNGHSFLGTVRVSVPRNRSRIGPAVDDGSLFDSTEIVPMGWRDRNR